MEDRQLFADAQRCDGDIYILCETWSKLELTIHPTQYTVLSYVSGSYVTKAILTLSPHFSPLYCTSLNWTERNTSLHCNELNSTSLNYTKLQGTVLYCTELHCNLLHYSLLLITSPHFTKHYLYCTEMYVVSNSTTAALHRPALHSKTLHYIWLQCTAVYNIVLHWYIFLDFTALLCLSCGS